MEEKRGRHPKLNGSNQRLVKRSYNVYPEQVEWVNVNGGSKLIRELIDKRRGRAMLFGKEKR